MPVAPSSATSPLAALTGTKTMFPGGVNSGGFFGSRVSRYARMNSIQIGSAAMAPVSLWPIGFRSSWPTQTPTVMSGSKPMNHASP